MSIQRILPPFSILLLIDTKENFLTSPTLPDVELKALAYSAFDEIIKISESDQGWRFVSDESGAAIQIVHKKTQTDSVIIRVGLAIAHPASEVFDLLMALHHRKRWDLKFLNGKVVRSLSENMDVSLQLNFTRHNFLKVCYFVRLDHI